MCECESNSKVDDLRFEIINKMHEVTGMSRSFLLCLYHDTDIIELFKICSNLQYTPEAIISQRYISL